MSRKTIILAAVAVVILIAGGVWFGLYLSRQNEASAESPYSAVVLKSGDIYFGELSWFPRPTLKNVWFLRQFVDQDNRSQVSVERLQGVFWGPEDKINLNGDEIVYWARLRKDSQVANLLGRAPAFVPPAPSQNQQVPPQPAPAPAPEPEKTPETESGPEGQ